MVDVVQCDTKSLPITLDIPITVSKSQVSPTTDLTKIAFVTPETPTDDILSSTGAGRIRYYTTQNAVADDFGTAGESYKAALTFFSQKPRAKTLAIATAFTTPQAGFLKTGVVGDVAALNAFDDASFRVTIDGDTQDIVGVDLLALADYTAIAAAIEAALNAVATGGYTAATVTPSANSGSGVVFYIASGTAGDGSLMSYLEPVFPAVGTDISGAGLLNGQLGAGQLSVGYTPTGLAGELTKISEAASCSSGFVYGYVLDDIYRSNTPEMLAAAAWAEAQFFAILGVESTDPLVIVPGESTSAFYSMNQAGYRRTLGFYADDTQLNEDESDFYHSLSGLAYMLSVNYSGENTAANLKDKDLIAIPPTPISVNDLNVALSKRANVFTTVGNGNRVVQNGTTFSNNWYVDETIDVDNFVNDMTTSVYNVFLTNPKVPYTNAGFSLLYQAIAKVGEKYTRNGVLADRVDRDSTSPTGFKTTPAYQIIFPELADVSVSDRGARILNGTQIILQLSEAINTLTLDVVVKI